MGQPTHLKSICSWKRWSKPPYALREHSNCYLPLGRCWKPVNLHNEALCLKKVTRGGIWVRNKFGLNINLQQLSNKTATQVWQVHEKQPEEEKSGGRGGRGKNFLLVFFWTDISSADNLKHPPALFCELEADERSFLNPGVDRPLRRTFLGVGGVKTSD